MVARSWLYVYEEVLNQASSQFTTVAASPSPPEALNQALAVKGSEGIVSDGTAPDEPAGRATLSMIW